MVHTISQQADDEMEIYMVDRPVSPAGTKSPVNDESSPSVANEKLFISSK